MDQLGLFDAVGASTPTDPSWRPSDPPSLDGIDELELDCETDGLKWWRGHRPVGIAIRLPTGCHYLPWGHLGGPQLDENTVKRWAQRELRGKRITGANIRFDNHHLHEWGIDLEAQGCILSDVQHQAALLDDNRREFGLDALGRDLLGVGKFEGVDVSKPGGASIYPSHFIGPYAERDVWLTGELKEKFKPLIAAENLQKVVQLEEDLIYPVCEMERNAAPIDVEKLQRWVVEAEQQVIRWLWELHRETGLRIEPGQTESLVKLFAHEKLDIRHWTEKHAPSFSDEALRSYDNPRIAKLRKIRKLTSLNSKYLSKYAKGLHGNLLRYSLHQLRAEEGGTISGRFSSSGFGDEGANIQQVMTVHKQQETFGDLFCIRELFVPGSGLYLSADAAQIEFRIFAHYTGSESLLKAYRDDPKTSFHMFVWEIVKKFNPGMSYKNVKNLNFAQIYGAGVGKTSIMLDVDMVEAEEFVASYTQAFPDVRRLLRKAANMAETNGYVKTLLGRRVRFPNRERLHKALNGVIQGGAADIMKRKLVELHRECRGFFKMRMTVHDEVCGDVPDLEAARKVGEILNRQSYNLSVPILWEGKTGANWKECA